MDYSDKLKDVLKAICEERNLDTSGTKAELIERLEKEDAKQKSSNKPKVSAKKTRHAYGRRFI